MVALGRLRQVDLCQFEHESQGCTEKPTNRLVYHSLLWEIQSQVVLAWISLIFGMHITWSSLYICLYLSYTGKCASVLQHPTLCEQRL